MQHHHIRKLVPGRPQPSRSTQADQPRRPDPAQFAKAVAAAVRAPQLVPKPVLDHGGNLNQVASLVKCVQHVSDLTMKEATVAEIEHAIGAMTEAEQHTFKVSLCVEAGRHDIAAALALDRMEAGALSKSASRPWNMGELLSFVKAAKAEADKPIGRGIYAPLKSNRS